MESSMNLVSPVDVLRNYFGELPGERALESLTVARLDDLGELLVQSADASVSDPVPSGTYYPGGWLGAGWNEPVFSSDLNLALLYYPRLLVHDPLSGYFFNRFDALPKMREIRTINPATRALVATTYSGPDLLAQHNIYQTQIADPSAALNWFKRLVKNVVSFAPLIDKNILILRPQWPTILQQENSIMASVRHDVRSATMQEAVANGAHANPPVTRWDNVRGMNVTANGGIIQPSDEPWIAQGEFFYLAKTLAVASAAGATYVPPTDADFSLVRAKTIASTATISGFEQQPTKILREVARLVVPNLQLDAKTTIQLRQDDESFDAWRRQLSSLARDSRDDDDEMLAARVDDTLVPRIYDINRNLRKTKPLRTNLIADGATVAIAGGIGFATGGPALAALAAAPGAIGWLFKSYQRQTLSMSDTVLARLIRK